MICIGFEIISAIFITIDSLVFCNTMNSIMPPTFTIPVIEISPTAGKTLFTPDPGFKGVFLWICTLFYYNCLGKNLLLL